MKKTSRIVALLIMLMAVSFGGFAQQQKGKMGEQKQLRMKHEMLPDLTDTQKEQMKSIHLKTMKAVQPMQNELREMQAHLTTLSAVQKVDMKAINKQIDEIADLKASIQKTRAGSKQEVRSLLTDDQRVMFDAHKGGMKHKQGRNGNENGCNSQKGQGYKR